MIWKLGRRMRLARTQVAGEDLEGAMGQRDSFSIRREGVDGGEITVAISGRLAVENFKDAMMEIQLLWRDPPPSSLTVDLEGVDYLDSAGALLLDRLETEAQARSIPFRFVNLNERARGIMSLVDKAALRTQPLKPFGETQGFFEYLGEAVTRFVTDLYEVLAFVGELLRALGRALTHPKSVRWGEVRYYMQRVGVDGLPIVALISFLLGLIMAFMSSLQLKQFGANIYVASLVGIGMVRELGPIMTAILVAGRSGSAFAAEIGTMEVNEEVDALTVMGFDPTTFLAVPKVLAAVMVLPILTVFADVFAIAGGLLVGVTGLDLTIYTYLQQTMKTMTVFDIVSGLVKSMAFAMLIAGIGCQRGFQVKGGAQAVGAATTSAVVSALFLIIVADSAFAVVLHYIS